MSSGRRRGAGGGGPKFYEVFHQVGSSTSHFRDGGGGPKFYEVFHQGGGASAQRIHLTECSTCEVCGAALPFPSWEEGSGRLGGPLVKEQFVRGADGELTSSVGRGSEATEERGFTRGGHKPLRGFIF